jgi:hypothetical protein
MSTNRQIATNRRNAAKSSIHAESGIIAGEDPAALVQGSFARPEPPPAPHQ